MNMDICRNVTWNELDSYVVKKKFSCLTVNMRSIISKFSELSNNLSSIKHKFTFIVITESWLTPFSDFALNIDGYKSFSL